MTSAVSRPRSPRYQAVLTAAVALLALAAFAVPGPSPALLPVRGDAGLRAAVYSGPTIAAKNAPVCGAGLNTPAVSTTLNTTAGDLVYVVEATDISPSPFTVSVNDSVTNVYLFQHKLVGFTGQTIGVMDWLATAKTTGADNITSTKLSGSGEQTGVWAFDVHGAAGIDGSLYGQSVNPTFGNNASVSITTGGSAPANALLFASIVAFNTVTPYHALTGTALYGSPSACSTDLEFNGLYDENATAGVKTERVGLTVPAAAAGFLEAFTPAPVPRTPLCGASVVGNVSSGTLHLPPLNVPIAHESVVVAVASEDNTATLSPPTDGANTYVPFVSVNNTFILYWAGGVESTGASGGSFNAVAVFETVVSSAGALHISVSTGHDAAAIAWGLCRIAGHPDNTNYVGGFSGDASSTVATSFNNESVVGFAFAASGTVDWSVSNLSEVNQTRDHAGFPAALGGVYDSGAATSSYPVLIGLSPSSDWSLVSFSLFNAPPKPPTGVSVTGVTNSTATVSWTAPTQDENNNATVVLNETVYLFLGAICSGGSVGFSSGGPHTSALLSGLANLTTFSVDVTAWNSFGESNASGCVLFTTLGPVIPPPLGGGSIFPLIMLGIVAALLTVVVMRGRRSKSDAWERG